MKRVTGIGGVFLRCKNPEATKAWYKKHLGINAGPYGATFRWRDGEKDGQSGHSAWTVYAEGNGYFGAGARGCMINYRVDDLEALLAVLRDEGVQLDGDMETYDYGKFGWVIDPEGNRVELWEPNDAVYASMAEAEAEASTTPPSDDAGSGAGADQEA
jgi:predicted enzyme related to lactoylglutathione lyase